MALNNATLRTPSLSVTIGKPYLKNTLNRVVIPSVTGTNSYRPKKEKRYATDMGDILLGDFISGTKQLQNTLAKHDMSDIEDIFLLNRIAGLVLMVNDRFIEPVKEGKPLVAGVNALETVGNTLDMVANPIKSLMPWTGGGSSTDLFKSMGWIEGEYRETYQWNTGLGLVDFVGELISDPIDWVTWGSSILMDKGVKALDDVSTTAFKKYVIENTDGISDAFIKDLGARLSNDMVDDTAKLAVRLRRAMKAQADQFEASLKSMPLNSVERKKTEELIKLYRQSYRMNTRKQLLAMAEEIKGTKQYRYLKAIRGANSSAQAMNKALIYLAGLSVPQVGVTVLIAKRLVKPTFMAAWNKWVMHMDNADVKNMFNKHPTASFSKTYAKVVQDNKTINKIIYKKYDAILAKSNTSIDDLQKLHLTLYNRRSVGRRNMADVNKEFKEKLMYRVKGLTAEQATELTECIADATALIALTEQLAYSNFLDEVNEEMRVFWASKGMPLEANKTLADLDPIERITYITETYMTLNGRRYTLSELDEFLAALNQQNPERYELISSLLSYCGISVHNAKRVDSLLAYINHGELIGFKGKTKHSIKKLLKQLSEKDEALKGIEKEIRILREFRQDLVEENLKAINEEISSLRNAAQYLSREEAYELHLMLTTKHRKTWVNSDLAERARIIDARIADLKNRRTILKADREYIRHSLDEAKNYLLYLNKRLNTIEQSARKLLTKEARMKNAVRESDIVKKLESLVGPDLIEIHDGTDELLTKQRKTLQNILLNNRGGRIFQIEQANKKLQQKLENARKQVLKRFDPKNRTLRELMTEVSKSSDAEIIAFMEAYKSGEQVYADFLDLVKFFRAHTDVMLAVTKGRSSIINGIYIADDATDIFNLSALDRLIRFIEEQAPKGEAVTLENITKFFSVSDEEFIKTYRQMLDEAYFEIKRVKANLKEIIKYRNTKRINDTHGLVTDVSTLHLRNHKNEIIEVTIENLNMNKIDRYYNLIVDLDNTLNKKLDVQLDNLLNLLDNQNSIKRLKLPELGAFYESHANLILWLEELSPEARKIMDELCNPNSTTRSNLYLACQKLRETNDMQAIAAANAIEQIIVNYNQQLLFADLLERGVESLGLELGTERTNFLTGMLYNTIHKYKHLTPAEALNQIDTLMDYYMTQVANNINQNLADKLIELGTIKEMIVDYLQELNRIVTTDVGIMSNIPITIKPQYFSSEMVKQMNQLGLLFEPMLLALDNAGVPISVLRTTSAFTLLMSGDSQGIMIDLERNRNLLVKIFDDRLKQRSRLLKGAGDGDLLEDAYDDLTTDEILQDQSIESFNQALLEETDNELIDILTKSYEKSAARNITSTFQRIDEINRYLRGVSDKSFDFALDGKTIKELRLGLYYIDDLALREYIRDNTMWRNAYAYSTANHNIGFKNVNDMDFIIGQGIRIENLNLVNYWKGMHSNVKNQVFIRYMTFYNNYYEAYELAKHAGDVPKKVIEAKRSLLIDIYSTTFAEFGPKNAFDYFRDASDTQIIAWDIITRSKDLDLQTSIKYNQALFNEGLMNNAVAEGLGLDVSKPHVQAKPVYSIDDRIEYNESLMFSNLRSIIEEPGLTEVDAYDDMINSAPLRHIHTVMEYEAKSMSQWLKDPETLEDNSFSIFNYVQQNVQALERVRSLEDIASDNRKVGKVINYEKHKKYLIKYGITADSRMSSREVQTFLAHERALAFENSLLAWNASQVRSWLDHNTDGMFVYVSSNKHFNYAARFSKQELNKAGLVVTQMKDTPNIFVIRRTDRTVTNTPYKYYKPKYVFEETQKQIDKIFKANEHYFYWDGMDVPNSMFTGNMLDLDDYEIAKQSNEMVHILGDKTVQKTYLDIDKKGRNNFYKKRRLRPNFAIVGAPDARTQFFTATKDAFLIRNRAVPYEAKEIWRTVWRGNHDAILRANSEVRYLELFLNKDFSLGNKLFRQMFEKVDDARIQQFFERGNYVAVVIKQDAKQRPKVYKIYVNNHKQLQDAIDAGAICVPHEVYRNMVLTINRHKVDNKWIALYKRTIVGTYKTIYLSTPGFLMRNAADSIFYKNASTSGGTYGMFQNFKYESQAMKLWKFYQEQQAKIIASTGNTTFSKPVIRKHLAKLTPAEREMYMLVDAYTRSSASGGLSDALQELLLKYNKQNSDFIGFAWEEIYNEDILHNKLSPVHWIQDVNSQIEHVARLGLYLKVLDVTHSVPEAIKAVVRTHFDYDLKFPHFEFLEDIFWFSTFPINNMFYYINKGITDNPDLFKAYMDAVEQSWNSNGVTWDNVRHSNYLAYNALKGNLRFKLGNNNIILKLGSSALDVLQILMDPTGELKDRLNPFLSVLLGIDEPTQLNPLEGIANRGKQIIEGQSFVPSVYSKMYPIKQYRNNYNYNNYYRGYRYSRIRTRKRYNKSVMTAHWPYTKHTYWFKNTGSLYWTPTGRHDYPKWYSYPRKPRYKRYRGSSKFASTITKVR